MRSWRKLNGRQKSFSPQGRQFDVVQLILRFFCTGNAVQDGRNRIVTRTAVSTTSTAIGSSPLRGLAESVLKIIFFFDKIDRLVLRKNIYVCKKWDVLFSFMKLCKVVIVIRSQQLKFNMRVSDAFLQHSKKFRILLVPDLFQCLLATNSNQQDRNQSDVFRTRESFRSRFEIPILVLPLPRELR